MKVNHPLQKKPFQADDLLMRVRRALEIGRLKKENARLRSQVGGELSLREQMGPSEQVGKLLQDIQRVAPTNFTVVINGETGAGKELVARAIHRLSPRCKSPLVTVDCGAIPPSLMENEFFGHEKGAFTGADRSRAGSFETANHGTLFLDEMANLPLPMQAKLLRGLQERKICRVGGNKAIDLNVRVLAASNEGLAGLVEAGSFRRDLYHRLGEYHIKVPPLRERPEDIVYLASRFLEQTARELDREPMVLSPETQRLLVEYAWPGNVRELRNVIRQAALAADRLVRPEHLVLHHLARETSGQDWLSGRQPVEPQSSFWDQVRHQTSFIERDILWRVLQQTGGNKARAARLLHIDYKTICYKIKKYGITVMKSPMIKDDREKFPFQELPPGK